MRGPQSSATAGLVIWASLGQFTVVVMCAFSTIGPGRENLPQLVAKLPWCQSRMMFVTLETLVSMVWLVLWGQRVLATKTGYRATAGILSTRRRRCWHWHCGQSRPVVHKAMHINCGQVSGFAATHTSLPLFFDGKPRARERERVAAAKKARLFDGKKCSDAVWLPTFSLHSVSPPATLGPLIGCGPQNYRRECRQWPAW